MHDRMPPGHRLRRRRGRTRGSVRTAPYRQRVALAAYGPSSSSSPPWSSSKGSLSCTGSLYAPSIGSGLGGTSFSGLSVSRSKGQPLANDAPDRTRSTLSVVDTKSNAVAVPEIKFAEITVQMVLGAMLIDALHAPLEDRKISFNGVSMSYPAHPFLFGMVDGFVSGEPLSDIGIGPQFVSHQGALGISVVEHRAPDV